MTAATTMIQPPWPQLDDDDDHHGMQRDSTCPTLQVNFVIATVVVLLSLLRKKNARLLGSRGLEGPVCYSHVSLGSAHSIQ